MNLGHAAALMSVVLYSSSVRADEGWWFLACDRSMLLFLYRAN
jgi:hypothetical protein